MNLLSDWLGEKIYQYDSIDSTQAQAEKLAQAGASHGTVICAREQLAGRGRLGRSWHSAADKGVWLSIIIRPQFQIDHLPQITLLSSLAIRQTLEQLYDLDTQVKWPNDIYFEHSKLGGILTQARINTGRIEYAILGIGLNTDQTTFPENLLAKPISIEEAIGYSPDKQELMSRLLSEIADLYNEYEVRGFMPFLTQYLENLYGKDELVMVDNQLVGKISGVNHRGELILIDKAEVEHIVASGEIKFKR